jgi:pimeloyl-ACP methyl ester carboxylesterase
VLLGLLRVARAGPGAQNRTMVRRTLVVLLASALVSGCGGHGAQSPTAAKAPPIRAVAGPGRLVPIGGGRSLFIHCVGSGSPTVVLEAGFGGDSHNWDVVQPQLGRITRTCAYDRAGLGNSVALPGIHDARAEIADLARLLGHARLAPPYVLVGHSYGGLLARLYARAHPGEVRGMVLVDSMGRDQTRRGLAIWPRNQARALRRGFARRVENGVDLAAGEALAARIRSLGDIPLAVVTAGILDAGMHGAPRPLVRNLYGLWTTMQDELAALSPDHVHVVALHSEHVVQGPGGQPAVVVRAVRAVVGAAREETRLPPCRTLFAGPGVRCRG